MCKYVSLIEIHKYISIIEKCHGNYSKIICVWVCENALCVREIYSVYCVDINILSVNCKCRKVLCVAQEIVTEEDLNPDVDKE